MPEVLEISDGWAVELETPECELQLSDNCERYSSFAVRVHSCTMHYACSDCIVEFSERIENGFGKFKKMRCSACKRGFSNNKKYYEIIEL